MKRMLWMLPLLFAGMTAAAQNQDMARLGTYMDNGEFVVGTAETVLAADITVRCEKIVCGPYARYAQKFLGLRALLTDKTVYTVADAAIALMPGERYVTAGELPASTCRVESYEAQGADFARLQTDRLDMTETDLQTAARNAAAAIFSLRKHRLDLISGEAGENVFGAGLPVALERLDRLEQEYLELFLGRRDDRNPPFPRDARRGQIAADRLPFQPRCGVVAGQRPDGRYRAVAVRAAGYGCR